MIIVVVVCPSIEQHRNRRRRCRRVKRSPGSRRSIADAACSRRNAKDMGYVRSGVWGFLFSLMGLSFLLAAFTEAIIYTYTIIYYEIPCNATPPPQQLYMYILRRDTTKSLVS